jgi:dimethylglycine dehydrogenase
VSEISGQARVVIIGGGVVGVSALYHLAKAGWTDCVLLEKNELTAGSTWHAAGNVPTFSSSWSIMNMQRYSAELYRGLAAAVDYPMNYHVTGSIRLGHSKERLQEFQRVVGMGRYQGMDLDILSPDEIKSRYPFAETHDLTGALYDPNDGDIDPAQLTQALAKGARDLGAKIYRFCPATGARRENDEWVISTEKGEIRCEYVVNAAGYYAREVGKMFGRDVPMMVMSHQYMLFDEVPEVAAWTAEAGHKLPLMRDVDSSYYLRQEKNGFNLGPYERNCKAHWVTPDDPMPEDFSFQLYPDDLERLEWYINDACERVPLLGTAGLTKNINGPIPYTPGRQPADRADAGRAQCVRGLRLHLRHLPGRRRRQGAGRMGDGGRDRVGHVVVRPAPLHRVLRPGLHHRQGHGGLWPRIRHAFPASRLAGGAQQEALACA